MDGIGLVIVVLLVVVALAAIGFVVARGTRRREEARHEATDLRSQPVASGAGVHEANLEAQRAEEEAERLRREAAEAERRAAAAQQGVSVEEARQEDQLRRADRIDPDVKHRSGDYEPTPPAAGPAAPPEPGPQAEGRTAEGWSTEGRPTEGWSTEGQRPPPRT